VEKKIKAALQLLKKSRSNIDRLIATLSAGVLAIVLLAICMGTASAATQTTQLLQEGSPVALNSVYAAATSAGDSAQNDGHTFIAVKNGGGSTVTVTVTPGNPTRAVPGVGVVTKPTVTVSVAASGEALIGPFPPIYFNDANGNVNWTYSSVTSVTVAAVRLVVTQ
jgi:hypothetical protein